MRELRRMIDGVTTKVTVNKLNTVYGAIRIGDIIGIKSKDSAYFVSEINEDFMTLYTIGFNNSSNAKIVYLTADEISTLEIDLIMTSGDVMAEWNYQIKESKKGKKK